MGFVTSIDLAGLLNQQGLISQEDLESLVQETVPEILKQSWDEASGEIAFPKWLDCRDFFQVEKPLLPVWVARLSSVRWPWDPAPSPKNLMSEYHQKLTLRCSTRAVDQ